MSLLGFVEFRIFIRLLVEAKTILWWRRIFYKYSPFTLTYLSIAILRNIATYLNIYRACERMFHNIAQYCAILQQRMCRIFFAAILRNIVDEWK